MNNFEAAIVKYVCPICGSVVEDNIIIDVRQLRESCKSGKEVYGLHFEYVNIVPLNNLN